MRSAGLKRLAETSPCAGGLTLVPVLRLDQLGRRRLA